MSKLKCIACGSKDLYPNCLRIALCENHYFEWMLGNPNKTLAKMKKMWAKCKTTPSGERTGERTGE